jgi:hypothetical protein
MKGNRIQTTNLGIQSAYAIGSKSDRPMLASVHRGLVKTIFDDREGAEQVTQQAKQNIYLWNIATGAPILKSTGDSGRIVSMLVSALMDVLSLQMGRMAQLHCGTCKRAELFGIEWATRP